MKKFAAPLQAFAALLLCSGMAWMVFVLGSLNPAPPTANDLKARNTQDLSFANMNSTAVALAKAMLANMVPSPSGPIFLPVTGRETATPTAGAVVTLKPVYAPVHTPTPLSYYFSPTASRKKSDDRAPTVTPTLAPTRTPRPPIASATSAPTNMRPPTQTPVTPSRIPTETLVSLPTATPQPTTLTVETPTEPITEPTTEPTSTSDPGVGPTEPPTQSTP